MKTNLEIQKIAKEYPLIDLFIKIRFNIEKLKGFPVLIRVTNYLMNKYDHQIKRNEARGLILEKCFDENNKQILEDFENLKTHWNKYFSVLIEEACGQYKVFELNDSSCLSVLLVDSKFGDGLGIQTRLVIKHLAGCQNEFLKSLLENKNSLIFLKSFIEEPMLIHHASKNHIIHGEDINLDQILRTYALLNPKYGCGVEIDYDYDKIQLQLINKLVIDKKFLDAEISNIRTINYAGELMLNSYTIIPKIRELIKQEILGVDLKKKIIYYIEALDIENTKNILASLDTFLCFLSSSKLHKPESLDTFRDYAKILGLQRISTHVINEEPFPSLPLKHLVEVYEVVENKMFNFNKTLFKYKTNLDDLSSFNNFLKKCDGNQLPTKLELFNSIKKLAMRCFEADLDENDELYDYIIRIDLWPEGYEQKLENFDRDFPRSIKLMHTLGNLFGILENEFENIDKKKDERVQNKQKPDSAPLGRTLNEQSDKKRNKNKKLNQQDRIDT